MITIYGVTITKEDVIKGIILAVIGFFTTIFLTKIL